MDLNTGVMEMAQNLMKLMINHGSFSARNFLSQLGFDGPDRERAESFFQGINMTLEAQAEADIERINKAFAELSRLGITFPVTFLKEYGLPCKGLMVNYSPSTGRLGDFLGQLRTLVAIRYGSNNIVTCQLPKEISLCKSIVIGGDIGLDTTRMHVYELVHRDLEVFLDDASKELAAQCPWLLRYAPGEIFNKLHNEGEDSSHDTVVIHLRGGDALHNSEMVYHQPPLSYYCNAIRNDGFKTVKLISEPDEPHLNRLNPLREAILRFSNDKGLKVISGSGDLSDDCANLYNTSNAICGTSALGRELAFASNKCFRVFLPEEEPRYCNQSIVESYGLIERKPKICYSKKWMYPSDSDWGNLETRYNWLLNN